MSGTGEERTKIGPKVDSGTYNKFKRWVREKHNQTRGVLGKEIDRALEAHMDKENVTNRDLLDAIHELKVDATSPSETTGEHTQTGNPSDNKEHIPGSKPSDRASRDAKISWLAKEFRNDTRHPHNGKIPLSVLETFVREHYTFRDDTIEELTYTLARALAPEKTRVDGYSAPRMDGQRWLMKNDAGAEFAYLGEAGAETWVKECRDEEKERETKLKDRKEQAENKLNRLLDEEDAATRPVTTVITSALRKAASQLKPSRLTR